MSTNAYAQLRRLLPGDPLLYATVVSNSGPSSVVQLPGGSQINVRGTASPGASVFVRGGAIESSAPSLPTDNVLV